MVKRKASIPDLVERGQFRGMGAIPSGTIYSGQLVTIVGFGVISDGDYIPTTNNVVPIVQPVSATLVAASGVAVASGANLYPIFGVAAGDAPVQSTYQQLKVGKPLEDPTDVTMYQNTYDTDVRRMAIITENDAVQMWLPYSGSAPSAGDYLTLSSGVDGAVSVTADPITNLTVGIVQGYKADSAYSGVTVPGISAYVLTTLKLRF